MSTNESKNISRFENVHKDTDFPACNLGVICAKPDGTIILGAMGKDRGTLERRLVLAIIANGGYEISPLYEFAPSQCPKALRRLLDLDGIDGPGDVEVIWSCVKQHQKAGSLKSIVLGTEKATIPEAYQALVEYVNKYWEPGKVFIQDGYGNIESSYLKTVISKLGLGYSRLELLKNLKVWRLLRTNGDGAAHEYTYKIKKAWYCSFLLPPVEGGDQV